MAQLLMSIQQLRRRHQPSLQRYSLRLKNESPIGDPLCQLCQSKGIWGHLSNQKILGPAEWRFGFVVEPEDILRPDRQACPFCSLVFQLLPETAFAKEHQYLYNDKDVYCNVRPLAVRVRNEVFTTFLVSYNFREYVSHRQKVFSNYRGWIGLDSEARHRLNTPGITPMRLQDTIDVSLVRKWLTRCRKYHPLCDDSQPALRQPLSTMMIDLRRFCLVKADTNCTYIALSYVWGQVQSLQATKANINELATPGILQEPHIWSQIPAVIQDCITLAEALWVPFLWVDCLCIVQDDYMMKHDQIASMNDIYSQSLLTVIPYAGKNANARIPGVLKNTRGVQAPSQQPTDVQHGRKTDMVVVSLPEWPSLAYDAVHESRAWTLQEKVLSVRCLYLTHWGMWFQCLESRFSDVEAGELPLEPKDSNFPSLLRLTPPQWPPAEQSGGWDNSKIDEFLSYALHVEWYSARKLTDQGDRIDAFRGILNFFQDQCQQNFLWAHPEGSLLPLSLLWVHVDVGHSRDAKGLPEDGIIAYHDYSPDRDVEYPTWSWMG